MSDELVRYSVSDRVAEIMLDRPPVNALSEKRTPNYRGR
jgi:hypothetical protein